MYSIKFMPYLYITLEAMVAILIAIKGQNFWTISPQVFNRLIENHYYTSIKVAILENIIFNHLKIYLHELKIGPIFNSRDLFSISD